MCYEPWTVQRGCSDKRTVCRAGIQRGGISVGMQEFFRCGGALDWGITLQCDTTGKEDASSVGVRSHFIHPVLPEADGTTKNVFPCKVERVIEDVFSYILIVSTKEEARIRVDVTKEQWQQYQKHISGNKIWIGIDEKDVMLLK